MAEQRVQRRLAAILAADVAGYSRLMGEDEEGTLATLTAHLKELIEPCIAEHRGRVVKTTGDGLLVEFASVVDAVRCAVAFQEGMRERNSETPEDRRIEFRIGVNLGDVIVQEDDVYGDGVNVAARLEGLAEPGGVIVSGSVHEQVKGKLDVAFDDLGPQRIKNIAEPVRAFSIQLEYDAVSEGQQGSDATLPMPDKPSIAVLPFVNMSGDPEQEYFADGIAEDIITALSKFHWFFVIARNSSFTFKGKAVDVKHVAGDLGVRYVLQGSVRKAGGRVRITGQLVDATTGNHVWAETYDRELEDIFAVQDEITESIVASVGPEFHAAEIARTHRKDMRNLDAWDCAMRAYWHMVRFTKRDNAEAQRLLSEGIELFGGDARMLSVLAMSYVFDATLGWSESIPKSLSQAAQLAHQAIALDDHDAEAHLALGLAQFISKQHEDAIHRLERAIDLNPNYATAMGSLGMVLSFNGERDRAFEWLDKALRLSPHDPFRYFYVACLGFAEFVQQRYDDAIDWAKKAIRESPQVPIARYLLTACYGLTGRSAEAQTALRELLRVAPGATIGARRNQAPFHNLADMERYVEGLRKAGLPE